MWRNTGLTPQFFIIDYTAMAPMMLFAMRWDVKLLYLSIGVVLFLTSMKIWHITPMAFLRILRLKIGGAFFFGDYRLTTTNYLTYRRRVRW